MAAVRLTDKEIEEICTAFRQFFGPEDHLWVFGSRTDLQACGGDIDLYIETTLADPQRANEQKISFVTALYYTIGDQKIDVALNLLSSQYKLPIYEIARREGIQLA